MKLFIVIDESEILLIDDEKWRNLKQNNPVTMWLINVSFLLAIKSFLEFQLYDVLVGSSPSKDL